MPGRRSADHPRADPPRRVADAVIAFGERCARRRRPRSRRAEAAARNVLPRKCDNRVCPERQFTHPAPCVTAIIAAGGAGHRLGAGVPKQLLDVGGVSILQRSVVGVRVASGVDDVIVALPPELAAAPPMQLARAEVSRRRPAARGGRIRWRMPSRSSIRRTDVVLVHDAARPFVTADLISRAITRRRRARRGDRRAARERHRQARSPRRGRPGHRRDDSARIDLPGADAAGVPARCAQDAVALGGSGVEATDEAALAERAGHAVHIVEASSRNVKITTAEDLAEARRRVERAARRHPARSGPATTFIGSSKGGRSFSAAWRFPSERGALGHSDADVVCHAATDAILGAARSATSAGTFPTPIRGGRERLSLDLLRRRSRWSAAGFRVVNLDVVVILERPKIAPSMDAIRRRRSRARIRGVRRQREGKTNEGVDAVGRGEAIAAHAVVLLA